MVEGGETNQWHMYIAGDQNSVESWIDRDSKDISRGRNTVSVDAKEVAEVLKDILKA